jgi:uncharacterized protein (TIGR00156 family)
MKSMMKRKIFLGLAIMSTLIACTLGAQEGYIGPGLTPVTVNAAKKLRDDSPVTLHGKIDRFLGDEKYLFSDNSGSVIIEVDRILWRGLIISETDMVEITGEIDKDFDGVEIDVSSIKKTS